MFVPTKKIRRSVVSTKQDVYPHRLQSQQRSTNEKAINAYESIA